MSNSQFKFEVQRLTDYCTLQEMTVKEWRSGPGEAIAAADRELAAKVDALVAAHRHVLEHVRAKQG